jgi:hypothetical protein
MMDFVSAIGGEETSGAGLDDAIAVLEIVKEAYAYRPVSGATGMRYPNSG